MRWALALGLLIALLLTPAIPGRAAGPTVDRPGPTVGPQALRSAPSASSEPALSGAKGQALSGSEWVHAQDDLPIFDTHIHYSSDAWSLYSVDEALALLARAGVYRALVSSTPDDGTLLLYERAPDRIVPILRPYRSRADIGTWTRDPTVLSYVEERLAWGGYRGIGEFHLGAGEASALVPRGFARLAAQYDLFLHAHSDDVAVEELASLYPNVKILWAHAGMSAGPATVGRLLDSYPNLWVELALRGDVAPGGALDGRWSALFQRHPDRFMVGTDTWIPSQWTALPRLMADVQTWLRQLPPDVAEQIAWRNAERLFSAS